MLIKGFPVQNINMKQFGFAKKSEEECIELGKEKWEN